MDGNKEVSKRYEEVQESVKKDIDGGERIDYGKDFKNN